ncbi:MAG: hypothetical protein ABIA02_04255 [Candidatus Falkowbacteria bacterium]
MENNITINDLAVMIKKGFDHVDEEIKEVKQEIKEVKRSQDEIKLKFGYVAWAIDLEEVKNRLAVVEGKVGVKK